MCRYGVVMRRTLFITASFLVGLFAYYFFDSSDTTFTLYRNSIMDENMRLHIATFDTANTSTWGGQSKDAYNKGNCDLAASLFQQQPGVKTKFWCEKGRYKK